MNEPKKQEPQQPENPQTRTPSNPTSEFEKNIPHNDDNTVAMSQEGVSGEGSYRGTKQYQDGYKKFSQQTSPDDAVKKATKIDPNDPSLEQAERQGKGAGRASAPSVH